MKSSSVISIRDICFIAVFTAIIAVCAQISVPVTIAGVPLTLQTFAVMLAGIILGAKKGCVSVVIYVLIGAVGIPVFSGFTGGVAVIFGKTGGFILSFPLMALCSGIFTYISAMSHKNLPVMYLLIITGLILGAIINYICGLLMFCFITSSSLRDGFIWCVLPFIPIDIIKIILSGVVGLNIKNIIAKNKIL